MRSKNTDLTLLKANDEIGCPTNVLELLGHTCRQAIADDASVLFYESTGNEHMKTLEAQILSTVGDYGSLHVPSAARANRNEMTSDLHRLASLIYINRAVHRISGTEFQHVRLVRGAIRLLTEMKTCQSSWPLFIIACEAVDDAQRLAILDVFEQSRQEQRRRSNHVHIIQQLVEAVWNQQDLDEEDKVDHMTIFDAVVGSVPFIPPFA